jgi:WD40 repeat protein
MELLFDHVCPYLDRCTLNNVMLVSKQAYKCLTSDDRPTPPWPRKLISRDHMCRIRSMVFSPDGTELACGCSDGSIKVWHVWTGEQKPSSLLRGHWPGEAVLAVAYSNDLHNNNNKSNVNERSLMLVSSSTDHTIRLWKKRSIQHRPKGPFGETNTKVECDTATAFENDISLSDDSNSSSSSTVRRNITIQIRDAGHAYTLMFSPDNTYLVSGHHPQAQLQPRHNPNQRRRGRDDWGDGQPPQQQNYHLSLYPVPETIYLWSVVTGLKMRRLENGGMPIGFLRPMVETTSFVPPDHRLLTTCAGECLKLWSLSSAKKSNHSHSSTTITCLQRFFLDGYTTVMPVPLPSLTDIDDDDDNNSCNTNNNAVTDIMVASIDGNDSFTVWNTGGIDNNISNNNNNNGYKTFANASPYEIKFTTNCTKVASVDNFTQVKVWNVQSGKLLKSFVQDISNSGTLKSSTAIGHSSSISGRCHGGFPIHELAFCQDSTVAVVSRFQNEIHLFST